MEIKQIKKETREGQCIVSAQIVHPKGVSDVYFSVDQKYAEYIVDDASPFLALALVPAMTIGENLRVTTSVSQDLLMHAKEYIEIFCSWNVGMHRISIAAPSVPDMYNGSHAGCFFSGGIDSFYTFLKYKDTATDAIDHLIFVLGFDIELSNRDLYTQTMANLEAIAQSEGKQVISVKTNARDFLDQFSVWDYSHGGALGSVALLLRKAFKKVFVPSSYDLTTLHPWGSHPDLDHLWSTETLGVVHDGTDKTRVEKTIEAIAKSQTALRYLRVCWKNERGKYNCGRCPKCVRTMIDLEIAGVLNQARTFEGVGDLAAAVRNADGRSEGSRIYYKQSLAVMEFQNRLPELQVAVRYLLFEKKYGFMQRVRDFVAVLDRKYNRSRLYKFLSSRGII